MGCVNTSPVIKVKSINPFKKEIQKNEIDNLAYKILHFSDFIAEDADVSNISDQQSQILIDAKIENNELVFL